MTMKRHILAFTSLAFILCSCQKNVRYTPAREDSLMNYAYTLFYDMVAAPTIAMNVAYELQDFLNMSEDRQKSHIFADMVVQYDRNKYALLLSDGFGRLIINTNGCKLDTPGQEWNIYIDTEQLLEYYSIGALYYGGYSDTGFKIECVGDGQWNISGDVRDGVCRLSLADDGTSQRTWLARTRGSETEDGATGIRSDYCTCSMEQKEEDFQIVFQKHATDDVKAFSFNGTFLVLISSFDEIKERALILGKPGFAINCITEISSAI